MSNNKKKLTNEQIQSIIRISEALKFTPQEKVLYGLYRVFYRGRCRKVARSYGVNMKMFKKNLRKKVYQDFAFGMVFNDFGAFHTWMLCKCRLRDTNWTKYISRDGKVVK